MTGTLWSWLQGSWGSQANAGPETWSGPRTPPVGRGACGCQSNTLRVWVADECLCVSVCESPC